ncbi:MAG: OmpA family protein [Terriglobales bacterium]
MTHRFWIALPLAAALMAPAMAQTNSTPDQNEPAASSSQTETQQNTQQAPAAQPAQTTTAQPSTDQGLSARQPLTQERHEGFWGKINPFARKKYVQRQVQPIRDRVNELDELTAANARMIRDVDARATEGIRLASAKANEADQHAIEATNRAQMANQTAQQASTRLNTVEQVVGNIDQYQATSQTEIRFRPGQVALSKKAKAALDEMAEPLKDQRGYIIEVQGFSAGHGRAAVENSQHMAQSVVRYLVLNHEIPVYRIYLLGMGNAPVPATTSGAKPRRTTGGRVEISLLKNNVDQLASFAAAPSEAAPAATTGSQGGVSGTTAAPAQTQPQPQYQQPAPQPRQWNAQPSSNMSPQPAPMTAPPAYPPAQPQTQPSPTPQQ